MNQSRLHGVEVDQADRLSTGFIDHHVVDLGVAVDRPVPQLSTLKRRFEHIHAVASFIDEPMQ